MRFHPTFTLNRAMLAALICAGAVAIAFLFWLFHDRRIDIINPPAPDHAGQISGMPCRTANGRPIAVMLAADPVARPLSGIGSADLVIEMPVTPDGITRMMAVFQCALPDEIGSIRSAREDFIPLAQGLDAIYAHWGGEHDALAELNAHIIDNVNALSYEGTTFYRKSGIPRPHNGFTSADLLSDRIAALGYRSTTSWDGYPHTQAPERRNIGSLVGEITVPYPAPMDIRYVYDEATDTYARWRGGSPEIDAATKTQVRAATVVTLTTTAQPLRDQYIRVRVIGTGTATVYRNGKALPATWSKTSAMAPLTFTDPGTGAPIPFAPGAIWISILAPISQ